MLTAIYSTGVPQELYALCSTIVAHKDKVMNSSPEAIVTQRKNSPILNIEPIPEEDDSASPIHLHRERRPSSIQSVCGIPGCVNDPCRLHTHRTYMDTESRRRARRRSQVTRHSDNPYLGQAAFTQAFLQHNPSLRLGSDGLPPLPFEAGEFERPFKELFNQFFIRRFDRVALIYRPPRPRSTLRQICLDLALKDPIYCLTIISQANLENLWETGHPVAEDRIALQLYSRLVSLCRRELEEPEQAKIDSLLFAIVAMFQYDLCLGRFEALHSHRKGLFALVSKRGGFHNLGLSLPYALRVDRAIAAFTSQLPGLVTPGQHATIPKAIQDQLSNRRTLLGSSWEDSRMEELLTRDVLSYCRNASVLVQIAKLSNVTFVPEMLPARMSPNIDFFYYFRDVVDQEFVHLNAILSPQSQESNTMQRNTSTSAHQRLQYIVILAVRIVTYMSMQANYMPAICLHFSQFLHQSLSGIETTSELFSNTQDLLLWILFAGALPTAFLRDTDGRSLISQRQWVDEGIAVICRQVLAGISDTSDEEEDDQAEEDEGDGDEEDAEYDIEKYHTSDTSSAESPISTRHVQTPPKQKEKDYIWSTLTKFVWAEELRPQFEEIWQRVGDRANI